jgi:hypothetical protein
VRWVSFIQPLLPEIQVSAMVIQHRVDQQAHFLHGQDQPDNGETQQDRHPEQGIERQQQRGDDSDQGRGQEVQHEAALPWPAQGRRT